MDYSQSDEELVGFDGISGAGAGILLPVVHNLHTDLYYKGSATRSSESGFYSRQQIDDLARRKRLTLLPGSVTPFPGAVAVYATIEFMASAKQYLPHDLKPQYLPNQVSVGFSTRDKAVSWLEQQSARILASADLLLERYCFNQVSQLSSVRSDDDILTKSFRLTELALSAAFDSGLRSEVYLAMGLALTLSKQDQALDNLFAFSVSKEFKNWQWQDFITRLQRRGDAKQIRAVYEVRDSLGNEKMSLELSSQVKLRKQFERDLATIRSIPAEDKKILTASTMAHKYHSELLREEEWASLEKKLLSSVENRGAVAEYTLGLDYLPLFVSDPMSYVVNDGIRITETGIRVNSIHLRRASKRGIALGPATKVLVKAA